MRKRLVRSTLTRTASLSFLFLVAALPWTVAPMSIALVLCAALTLVVWQLPPGEERWIRTPLQIPSVVWIAALAIVSLFALDPKASWPRVTKGLLLLLLDR